MGGNENISPLIFPPSAEEDHDTAEQVGYQIL